MADAKTIDAVVAMAEAETGVRGGNSKVRVCTKKSKKTRNWSKEEDQFLRENNGRISEPEIARRLNRSVCGVHNHRERELHLESPSKSSKLLSGEHVAMGMGVDGKSVHALIDRGIIPGWRLPTTRTIRMVDRRAFVKWLLDPMHWCYFIPERIGNMRSRGKRGYTGVYDYAFWEDARHLVLAARKQWKDQWLTSRQAADLMKIPGRGDHNVNRAIHVGNLPAVRWQNWKILKSSLRKGMMINALGRWVPRILSYQERGKGKCLSPRILSVFRRLICALIGCNTEGWEKCVDCFLERQWGPELAFNSAGEAFALRPHKMQPAWKHFFVDDDVAPWDHQICHCRRCGRIFWELETRPEMIAALARKWLLGRSGRRLLKMDNLFMDRIKPPYKLLGEKGKIKK